MPSSRSSSGRRPQSLLVLHFDAQKLRADGLHLGEVAASLLGELYGAEAHELFEPGAFGERPAAKAPALPGSYAAA